MIYLNGKFVTEQEAKIEHNDRGFLLSDGIFETMRVYDGEVACLSDHYERLKKSAEDLNIPFSMTQQEIKKIVYELLEKNELRCKNASLRLTLTRGTGPRGLLPPENINPTLMLTAFPLGTNQPKPLKVVVSDIRRNESSPLSNIKSLCYLDNIIARQRASKKGADECILLNTQGFVACASVANIFIVTEDGIITPRLEDGILPGITRKAVIEICKKHNIRIFEKAINETELMKAKEVFFTNRLVEIQPVVQINEKLINEGRVGEVTVMIQNLYKNFLANDFDLKKSKLQEEKISCKL